MCCYLTQSKFVVHKFNAGDEVVRGSQRVMITEVIPAETGQASYKIFDGLSFSVAPESELQAVQIEVEYDYLIQR